jgi:hypothetical protein
LVLRVCAIDLLFFHIVALALVIVVPAPVAPHIVQALGRMQAAACVWVLRLGEVADRWRSSPFRGGQVIILNYALVRQQLIVLLKLLRSLLVGKVHPALRIVLVTLRDDPLRGVKIWWKGVWVRCNRAAAVWRATYL